MFSIIMPLIYFQLIYLIPLMNFRGPIIFYQFCSFFSFSKLDFYYFFVDFMGISPNIFGQVDITQFFNLKAIGYSSGSILYNHIFLIIIWGMLATFTSLTKLIIARKWFDKSKRRMKIKACLGYFSKPSIFILILTGSAQFMVIAALSEILSLSFSGGMLNLLSFIFSCTLIFIMTSGSVLISISAKLQKFAGFDELNQNKSSRRIYILFFLQKLMIWWVFIVTKRGFFQIPLFAIFNGMAWWYLLNIKPFVKMRENFVVGSNFWIIGLATLGLTKFADLSEIEAPKKGQNEGEGMLLIALFWVHITIITFVFIIGDIVQFIRSRKRKRIKFSRFYQENEDQAENFDLSKKNEEIKDEEEINLPIDAIKKNFPRSNSNWDSNFKNPKRLSNTSDNYLRKSKDSK